MVVWIGQIAPCHIGGVATGRQHQSSQRHTHTAGLSGLEATHVYTNTFGRAFLGGYIVADMDKHAAPAEVSAAPGMS